MATNEQAAGTDAEWDTDDDLSEANLRAVDARANAAGFVERGLGFSADFVNDTLTIGSTGSPAPNYAIILDTHERYHLFPSQQTVSLHASTTNHVFVAFGDFDGDGTDEVYFHVDDDDSAPSDPSLKIGTVDTSADTTTELNRAPAITVRSLDVNQTNTYSPSNVTTDRTYDADSTTVSEVADVLGTLLQDLGLDD